MNVSQIHLDRGHYVTVAQSNMRRTEAVAYDARLDLHIAIIQTAAAIDTDVLLHTVGDELLLSLAKFEFGHFVGTNWADSEKTDLELYLNYGEIMKFKTFKLNDKKSVDLFLFASPQRSCVVACLAS